MKAASAFLAAALLWSASSAAYAQIAVSANDGKQLRPGEAANTRTTDHVSVIDVRRYPPRLLGSVEAPASMIGAPAAVEVARDASFALVSALQQLDAAGELQPAGMVSVIDLADRNAPKVVQTVQVSPGAGGVNLNRAGTLALVSSNSDDTISIFTVANKRLTPAGKVQLPQGTRPTDVVFAPDGRSALAVGQGAGKLIRLNIDGSSVTVAGQEYPVGIQPYGVVFSPDGRFAYNTNLGGNPRPAGAPQFPGITLGTVSAVDLTTGTVNSVVVGQTPETATLSRDGRYLAAVVHNGSAGTPGARGYNPYGFLKVYSVRGTEMTPVATAQTSPWCQGVVFTDDGRTILLQCALTKEIEVWRFNGRSLTQDKAASLKLNARPGSIATPASR